MSKISIAQVLSFIDQPVQDDESVTFSLDYVKADGSLGHMAKAQKSYKHAPAQSNKYQPAKSQSSSYNHNLKQSGNLLLWSHDKQGYREIKIALIIRFNNIPVFHG